MASVCRELERLKLCDRGSDASERFERTDAALAIDLLELAKASGEQISDRGGGHGGLSRSSEAIFRLIRESRTDRRRSSPIVTSLNISLAYGSHKLS